MHVQTLLTVLMPVLASASAIHSASAGAADASASPIPSTKHAANTGNSYGTDGISNKGNLACTGKCLKNPLDLHCPSPYAATPNDKDGCYLCCVEDSG